MAFNLANIRNLPAQLAASFKGLFIKNSEQTSSGVTGNLRRQLVVLLVISLIALLALLMYLLQVNRDNKFTAAAGDVQVFVQQAARDAALSTHFTETASIRLMNVMGSINSEIQLMRDLESATIFKGGQVKPLIDEIDILWKTLHTQIKEVHQSNVSQQETGVQPVDQAQSATDLSNIVNTSDQIIASARKAIIQYEVQGKARLWMVIAIVAGIGSLLLLVYIGYGQVSRARQQFLQIEQANLSNQEAILHLLDEMGDLADGDLTVKAQVTENITGAIADSINYTIDSLRDLVTEINRATEQVNEATAQAQSTSADLLKAAELQSQQISETGEAVTNMTRSILQVSSNAGQASQVAQRSLQAAAQGAQAVQNTIAGMNEIRSQIQETSKRIKRLGESSQEISEIVELISDITEQTNILALNAAIQAASAGEAGRGFTVVAEEVQRLAERSSEATKQISAIVKTIQTDTNSAVAAMEKSTEGVVEGARLSDAAGQALNEIETVTNNLARLIQAISTATVAQTEVAATVSRNMQQIQSITSQTTEGTKQTAQSIGQLTSLAEDLSQSVAGFKLS
ncbi:MAG TPA: methyl-accepting chemotaxis protein [Methylophilaceae bacterium]|nr:methyl-accepting chemotaxis protein [Methylophilaceae bacterium]